MNTKTKWTKGMWVAKGMEVWNDDPESRTPVCSCRMATENDETDTANAVMIASAPAMFDALQEAFQTMTDAFTAAIIECEQGSQVPEWIVRLDQSAQRFKTRRLIRLMMMN